MKNIRDNDLTDRRRAAADAKAALLQNYRAAKEAAEPTRLARQEERKAIAVAREERRAEKERLKRDEQMQIEAAAAAEAAVHAKAEKDRISRVIEDEAARKAARDQRYANRKARQR
ncbi:MAG: DUF6481 family protein [Salinarimonas sp.]